MLTYLLLAPVAGLLLTVIVGAMFDDLFDRRDGNATLIIIWVVCTIIAFYCLVTYY